MRVKLFILTTILTFGLVPMTAHAQGLITPGMSTQILLWIFGESESEKKARKAKEFHIWVDKQRKVLENSNLADAVNNYKRFVDLEVGNKILADQNKALRRESALLEKELKKIRIEEEKLQQETLRLQCERKNLDRGFWGSYEDRIIYKNFGELPFKDIPQYDFETPIYLDIIVGRDEDMTPHNRILFDSYMHTLMVERNLDDSDLAEMNVKQLIELANEIVGTSITYKSGFDKEAPEICLLMGTGNCNRYADLLVLVFKWLKPKNKYAKHVYVTRSLGKSKPLANEHAWNSIFIAYPDHLVTSQVDPTFSDNDGSFEARAGEHFNADQDQFLIDFYTDINESAGVENLMACRSKSASATKD